METYKKSHKDKFTIADLTPFIVPLHIRVSSVNQSCLHRHACVDYMTPLGLHHLMAAGHHYGPGPDYVHPGRADWSSTYYHKADSGGIGFDRSKKGSNGVSQYALPLQKLWNSTDTCLEKYLLWFHHLPWTHRLSSGKMLWEALQFHYHRGVWYVCSMQEAWNSMENKIDRERFNHVKTRLAMQLQNAREWRDVCLEYFGRFAGPLENNTAIVSKMEAENAARGVEISLIEDRGKMTGLEYVRQ